MSEKRRSIKKSIYLTNKAQNFLSEHLMEGESIGNFLNRLADEYPVLLTKAKEAQTISYELHSIKKMVNNIQSQGRVFMDLFNTTLHEDDFATLFTVEKNPEDIVQQAMKIEQERQRSQWIKTHNRLHAPGFEE